MENKNGDWTTLICANKGRGSAKLYELYVPKGLRFLPSQMPGDLPRAFYGGRGAKLAPARGPITRCRWRHPASLEVMPGGGTR